MADIVIDEMRQIRNEWIDENRIILESFPKIIAESWIRSHALGVRQSLESIPQITQWDTRLVTDFREQNHLETLSAKPLYQSMASFCDESAIAVALANESLRIFDLFGNRRIIETLGKRKIVLGSNFSESSCGTNAMCLAKETSTTQTLTAEQCYCEAFRDYITVSRQIASNPSVFALIFISCSDEHLASLSLTEFVFQTLKTLFVMPKTQIDKLLNDKGFEEFLDECGFCIAATSEDLTITSASQSFIKACSEMELVPGKNIDPLLRATTEHGIKQSGGHPQIHRGTLTTKHGAYQVRQYTVSSMPPRYFFTLKQTFTLDFLCKENETASTVIPEEFRYLEHRINACADVTDNMLIVGEDGTENARLARIIHAISNDKAPYFSIDCRAFDAAELTCILFGGYDASRGETEGALDQTRGGTLFLSSIDAMPSSIQARLADAIESGHFLRPYCFKQMDFATRIIASTETSPDAGAKDSRIIGKLRFNLDVMRIEVTPLRERKADFDAILATTLSAMDLPLVLDAEAKRLLSSYDWPGNTGELENVLLKLSHDFGRTAISAKMLSSYIMKADDHAESQSSESSRSDRHLSASLVKKTLKDCDGNKTRAAKALRVSRQTLYNYLKRYDIA